MFNMTSIHDVNLYGLDLNLLVAFDALMQERNVTRAARRVGLTQSAMSNALRRLRDMLEDPVLVRQGRTMVPTARAVEIEGPVRHALGVIRTALAPPPSFDPAESEHVFWLGGRDYMEVAILPDLAVRVAAHAPRVNLRFRHILGEPVLSLLEKGRFDVGIGYFGNLHEQLHREVLFAERYVVVTRLDHPLVRDGELSLEAFTQGRHMLIAPFGGELGVVDSALASLGMSRRISLTVADFAAGPLIAAGSDLICTVPARVSSSAAKAGLPIQILEPPIDIPSTDISMCWHERSHHVPAQQWLRDQIRACVRA